MAVRNPPWSRDELIIALDYYLKNRDSIPSNPSRALEKLSATLNALSMVSPDQRNEKFRNQNGVYMKLMNFRRLDPEYPSEGLPHGSKGDEAVWATFASDPEQCAQVATAVFDLTAAKEAPQPYQGQESPYIAEAEEGRLLTRRHLARERSRKLVEQKKQEALQINGRLFCEVCKFDFERTYGERGRGFIECHHLKPLHKLREAHRTRLKDLALVCSNCHRMIHSRRPWLTLDELRRLL